MRSSPCCSDRRRPTPLGTGLPVAGRDGHRSPTSFADHPVAGRLLGKTGTLNNPPFNQDPPAVKALAGYLPVDGGGAVEYTLILNGPTISDQSEYRPVWYDLVDAARHVSVRSLAPPTRTGR